MSNCATLWFLT